MWQLPSFLGLHVQKGLTKFVARTSMPCSNIRVIARVLSSPPDSKATALRVAVEIEEYGCR